MMGRAPSFGMGKLESMELPDAVAAVVRRPSALYVKTPKQTVALTYTALRDCSSAIAADVCCASCVSCIQWLVVSEYRKGQSDSDILTGILACIKVTLFCRESGKLAHHHSVSHQA